MLPFVSLGDSGLNFTNFQIRPGEVMSQRFNTKGNEFSCNYGSVVLMLRVASGILPAMFFVSSSDALFSFYICSHSKAEKVKFSDA